MVSNFVGNARRRRAAATAGGRGAAASIAMAAAVLAVGAGPAGAHGGDTALVHSCIDNNGNVRVVAANATCKQNEVALDWARSAAGATYTAGAGLSLTGNEFSVTGAPWSGLTGVPAGFADGVDDVGPALTWGNLTGIPGDLLDGDNDGSAAASAAVGALRTDLATDDGVPDQPGDPVSFSKVKDLTTASGDGRITGGYVRDGSLTHDDLANNSVNGDTIAAGSIHSSDLAPGVLDRLVATWGGSVPPIPSGQRGTVQLNLPFTVTTSDIVVVSPPANLPGGLVFSGSDVLADGNVVTVYLYNASQTGGSSDTIPVTWTIRVLRTGG